MTHAPPSPPSRALTATQKRIFWAILILAALLRAMALFPPSVHHPDEIFQYLEPAHKMLFGRGIVTWEYRLGMRSWLVPDILSLPMALGNWIAPQSGLHLLLPRFLVGLLSLSIPVSAFAIGRRYSVMHGLVAMAVMAFWFEGIYFASHVLTELLSVALFLPAAALMLDDREEGFARRYILAGVLIGGAGILRFHYGPAIAVFVLMTCRLDMRRWLPLIGGGIVALALSSLVDIEKGQIPFHWIIVNFEQNILHDRAAAFGVEGPTGYLVFMTYYWQWAMPLLFIAMVPVIPREKALAATALACLIVLSLIGHKEYRFILMTTTILLLLAGLGSAEWLARWQARRSRTQGRMALGALCLLWLGTSASLASTGYMAGRWTTLSPQLELVQVAGRTPGLCGMMINHEELWNTGGYSYLHRDVPLYMSWDIGDHRLDRDGMAKVSPAFNMALAYRADHIVLPANYRPVTCRGEGEGRVCLYARPGGCTPQAGRYWEAQTVVLRNDAIDAQQKP